MRRPFAFATVVLVLTVPALVLSLVHQTTSFSRLDDAFLAAARGANPLLVQALHQTSACSHHALNTKPFGEVEAIAWVPCVQQGDALLRDGHAEALIPAFHQRLLPVHDVMMKEFS